MSQTTKTTKSVADHIRLIYKKLTDLEARLDTVEGRVSEVGARSDSGSNANLAQPSLDNEIIAQVVELETRLKHLEVENRDLTDLCNQLQAQNEAISNLYVAKHRLHASLDATEIMRIVRDILSELVGAAEFAIFLVDPRKKALRRVTGVGVKGRPEAVALGEGYLGKVAAEGKPFYFETGGSTPKADSVPLAAIPLKGEAGMIGIIAIWRLLAHKDGFTPVDHQLLELVAEHAPVALMSAHLHQKSRAQK